ncbi:MAG: hypothetical protein K2X82_08245 [Gemmataceae bacterium]|nr:hypothetical protein [Gemmataceae bacterium]
MSAADRPAPKARPVKIDPADGPCEICQGWADNKTVVDGDRKARACDLCGVPIPVHPALGGGGTQAQVANHFHLASIEGQAVWMGVYPELCPACATADYETAFPGMDPNGGKRKAAK